MSCLITASLLSRVVCGVVCLCSGAYTQQHVHLGLSPQAELDACTLGWVTSFCHDAWQDHCNCIATFWQSDIMAVLEFCNSSPVYPWHQWLQHMSWMSLEGYSILRVASSAAGFRLLLLPDWICLLAEHATAARRTHTAVSQQSVYRPNFVLLQCLLLALYLQTTHVQVSDCCEGMTQPCYHQLDC